LGPRCDSADVGEALSYGFIERHQKTACRLLPPKFHKTEKPSLQAVIRIIALSSDAGVEIRKLVRIVVERMQLRFLINLEIGRFLWSVVKSNQALDVEVGAGGVEIEKRDTIPKQVVNPP
jgi:hypothetical protein